MKKLKICHRYEKMTLDELEETLKKFQGLSEQALDVVSKVTQIFIQNFLTKQDFPRRRRKDMFISK